MSNEGTNWRDLPTLRERAIGIRLEWLSEELSALRRGFQSNELAHADDQREWSEGFVRKLRAEIATLRAMPADVADDAVRVAMGVAA